MRSLQVAEGEHFLCGAGREDRRRRGQCGVSQPYFRLAEWECGCAVRVTNAASRHSRSGWVLQLQKRLARLEQLFRGRRHSLALLHHDVVHDWSIPRVRIMLRPRAELLLTICNSWLIICFMDQGDAYFVKISKHRARTCKQTPTVYLPYIVKHNFLKPSSSKSIEIAIYMYM